MIVNPDSRLQVFTFDKETEKKTGALTMLILSLCLFLSPMILALADLGLILGTYLLTEMMSVSISDGAVMDQSNIILGYTQIAFVVGIILFFTYALSGVRQLLSSYALLDDGRLIKMKWKLRRVRSIQARIIARKIAKHTSTSRSTASDAINGIYALFDGIEMIHNPLVILGHLNGSAVNENIIITPIDNVVVIKKTKKKLVIMADTLVKNKPKRKKITIYCMYCDMDLLCQICEGGYSNVN